MVEPSVWELFKQLEKEIIKYNPNYDDHLLKKAFSFAYEMHQHQYRKSKEPYIIHPLHTALNLTKIEADEMSLIAALLHDTLDNKSVTLNHIEQEFWVEVAKIVAGVSRLGELYYRIDMSPEEIQTLKSSLVWVGDDIRIFLVKLADRLHNLETLEFHPKQKRYRIAKETEEIYIPIANFLSIGEFLWRMQDLCFQYTKEDEYKKLKKIFWKKYDYHSKKIIEAHNKIEKEFQAKKIPIVLIEGRVKSLYSIYKKMKYKHLDYREIYDVLALRIITKTIQDAYVILGIIHKLYNVRNDRFKDYISTPKANGYQSIHTTVVDETGEFLEFQIQTQWMMKLNRSGLAAHFIYKWFWVDFKDLPVWMKWVLDVQRKTIDSQTFLEKLSEEIIISEIKIFDGNKNYLLLPKKAVLIDYAYSYSLEYGKKFLWAYINGVYVNDPFYWLKNGDSVTLVKSLEIYTEYKVENFSLLTTQIAKDQIQTLFHKYSLNKWYELGKYTLNQDLENLGMKHFGAYPQKVRQKVFEHFGGVDEDQFYLALWVGSIPVDQVVSTLMGISSEIASGGKSICLKVFFKTIDFLSLHHLHNAFYELGIDIKQMSYDEKKNMALYHFALEKNAHFQEILRELKRIPNVASITRVFPLRLQMYYGIYFWLLLSILGFLFLLNFFDISLYLKDFYLKIVLFWGGFLMIGMVYLLKYFTKTLFPDLVKYKRFWLSLFLLNTFIFWVIFYEMILLNISISWFWYLSGCFVIYISLFYDLFLEYKKSKKRLS